jgi:hypothetical protein
MAGLQRVRAQGERLGRPEVVVPVDRLLRVAGLPVPVAAERLGVSRSTVKRWRRQLAAASASEICTVKGHLRLDTTRSAMRNPAKGDLI